MYPSQTILVKGAMDNHLLDDDLSTLSGSSTGASFSRQNRSSRNQYNSNDGNCISNQHRKNKLHSYLNNSIQRQSNRNIIAAKRQPLAVEVGSCTNEGKDTSTAEAPFDEVPIAIVTRINSDCDDDDDNDDDGNDSNCSDSENSQLCESWEVQEDGNLEPVIQAKEVPTRIERKIGAAHFHNSSRGQNKFEKSEKSAFVPTASSIASRSGCSSDISYSNSISNSPARSTDGSVRQTRLERLKRRQNGRVLASNSTRTLLQRQQQHLATTNKDDATGLQQKRREITGAVDTNSNNVEESSKLQTSDDDSKLISSKADFERNVTRLQRKLKNAKLALNYQRKILSEMSKQEESEDMNNPFSARHNSQDRHDGGTTSLSCSSTRKLDQKLNDTVVSTPQPTSPKSLLSSDTRTTACTSSITSPVRSTTTTSVNRARMKRRFHRNRRNYNKQEPPLPKSPADGYAKSIELDINEPPNLKRRPNFSVLSADGEDDKREASVLHKESCAESHGTELGNGTAHDSEQVIIDEENKTLPSTYSSPDELHHKHTLDLSISISSKSLPALDNFLTKIMRDLDKYQENDSSILSIDTKCNSDSSFSQVKTKSLKEASGLKNENEDLNLISTPTSSFINDFRKAVDSLQASSKNNSEKNSIFDTEEEA